MSEASETRNLAEALRAHAAQQRVGDARRRAMLAAADRLDGLSHDVGVYCGDAEFWRDLSRRNLERFLAARRWATGWFWLSVALLCSNLALLAWIYWR